MSKINCLIVDDEPIARDIISNYCQHLGYLHVVASCGNALEARTILHSNHIDIVFLDINMPVMDGISFLKTIKNPPQIIFTTAYKEYAIDAFDLAACDYLLKPFSFDRFIMAIDKAMERLQPNKMHQEKTAGDSSSSQTPQDYTFIKTDGKIYKLNYHDLLYAEAQGNYTRIVTNGNTLMPKMPFTSFEELLPASTFLRVHRSFIINKTKIAHIEGNRLFINSTEIPIGNNYKEQLMDELGFKP